MHALYRARARLLVCLAVVVALGALVLAPAAGATGPGNTYLALGDSLAYGYHQAQFQQELKEKASSKRRTSTTATSTTSAPC